MHDLEISARAGLGWNVAVVGAHRGGPEIQFDGTSLMVTHEHDLDLADIFVGDLDR